MRYLWLATFGLALGMWLPPAAAAAEPTAAWGSLAPLATGRPLVAPAGWLNYCMAALERCLQVSKASVIEPTPAVLALVDRVQREVNARIQPRAEPAGLDLWQLAVTSGDCEDYALAKQAELRAAGVPAGAARLATARLASGEMHAVLAVETSRGTLILDNLHPGPVPVHNLDYTWLGEEAPTGHLRWLELSRSVPEVAGAPRHGATGTPRATQPAQ
jgi:predicted transglutaminase-like cysteine proteinase